MGGRLLSDLNVILRITEKFDEIHLREQHIWVHTISEFHIQIS